jgi:hypothetical protein
MGNKKNIGVIKKANAIESISKKRVKESAVIPL